VFYALAPLTLLCFGFFEYSHRRWSDVDFDTPMELPPEKSTRLDGMFRGIWPLVKPYALWNQQRHRGQAYVAVLLVLAGAALLISFTLNIWQGEFWNAFEDKDVAAFWHIMRAYVAIVITWVVVGTYTGYIRQMLEIDWRTFMTKRLQRDWLTGQAFYRMQLDQRSQKSVMDNPDQRIQEDVAMFVSTSLQLGFGLVSTVGQLVIFLPLLLMLSPSYAFGVVYLPGWLVFIALGYSLVGSFAAHFIGQELIRLGFARQRYEADFRYHVVQIRDSAEAIALYGSEEVEMNILNSRFEGVRRVFWELMLYQKRLGFFSSFYFITGWMFPFIVLAPSFFAGEITMGHLFQISSALGQIRDSFDWFISTYPMLADFRATSDRLLSFEEQIREARGSGGKLEPLHSMGLSEAPAGAPAALEVRGAQLSLPGSDRPLWSGASLRVEAGEGVLLSAPEGTGKSTFFRALAGVWPYVTGGAVRMEESLFVPQRSYIPQGSLRQAVAYPRDPRTVGDEAMLEALRAVRLEALAPDGDLGVEKNWALVLSGGEQQRVAFARVLLAKPRLVCLDEAASQVGEEGTRDLYAALRRELPDGAAFISISHEVTLMRPLHDTHYTAEMDPETKGFHWQKVS